MLSRKAVIICSGSEPRSLPGLEVDGERILTSDQATKATPTLRPSGLLLEALPHGVLPIGPDRLLESCLYAARRSE